MTGFPADLLSGKRYAVLGLGRNGRAAACALADMGADVTAWDDNEAGRAHLKDGHKNVTLVQPDPSAGFDALILSPGIPHLLPEPHPLAAAFLSAGIPVLSDAELLFEAVRKSGSKARFAGITGTNGKSTTTSLLAHTLRTAGIPVAEGGNLGPAALFLPLLPDTGVYVLEMSSYMLERLQTLHFDTACLLNMTPDHLDRHGDMNGYARAKAHIFDRMTPGSLAVCGISDPWTREIAAPLSARGIRTQYITGEDQDADIFCKAATIRDHNGLSVPQPPALPGAHNAENIAATIAMARFLGISDATIAAAVQSFSGLPHRQKRVAVISGITFIDDSKATNADAASRALGCYDRLVWIAGGLAKAGGIEDLIPYFPRIAKALLIGRDAPLLAETLRAHGVAYDIAENLDHAVPAAFAAAEKLNAPVVLLSPACASFDQFSGFEARGHYFARLVSTLEDQNPLSAGDPG
ncbi:UDP-N-acetylmuramoyl-L-alanine--D-glutamate ligase [Acetobacter sp. AN02]|uniref:UDP-N-acetylmuramoyl-L-alanine--D-glutamate ligase n=1 Tax=Acetobacter sp. AN02 TaxID=2894186 RepID=UPI0024341377|nr:UDP-N-acetylmuramoyl-L-alanine--D-glutamate ligase [Acetobacter sp. AN02]MDG6094213.1 UDP-N-acetylmuramoyl-L-alanine--D-glutamate ligase [Acetobacter sp. AN02]